MRELGIKAYRFSISWTRIFPDGTGKVNEKGVKFYSDLIDELLKNGIEPYITLFHWDYPYALFKKGSWLNDESVKWFAEYAGKVVELYSDRVKYFITFNEPQCFIGCGYLGGEHAPFLKMGYKAVFQMCHNVLKAHGAAVIAMREKAKQPIKIGYAPTGSAVYPLTDSPEDIEAAREKYFECKPLGDGTMWSVSWWSDPVILGRYPEEGLKMYKEYLPEITEEDMKLISQPIDFYCQNMYNGVTVKADENGKAAWVKREVGYPKTSIGWPITPKLCITDLSSCMKDINCPFSFPKTVWLVTILYPLTVKYTTPTELIFLTAILLSLKRRRMTELMLADISYGRSWITMSGQRDIQNASVLCLWIMKHKNVSQKILHTGIKTGLRNIAKII